MRVILALLCALVSLIALAVCQYQNDPKTPTKSGDVIERTKLYNHLFSEKNYLKNLDPGKTNVKFGVALLDANFNEKGNVLETDAWLRYVWTDSRLQWDKKEWFDIEVFHLPGHLVWKPDITLYNSANSLASKDACSEPNVLIYSNGEVLTVPQCHFRSHCQTTLKEHPHEAQNCTMKFASWTFDGNIMDLNLYNNQTEVDMSDYVGYSDWQVLKTTGVRSAKHYPCCAEPYIDLTFGITLQRKSKITQ